MLPMKNVFTTIFSLILFAVTAKAQQLHFSDAYNETQRQQAMSAYPIEKWDSLRCVWYGECQPVNQLTRTNNIGVCPLAKRMFGWHAIGTSSASYVWQSLSDLSYFSYQVNYLTGNATNAAQLVNWGNNATVLAAKANGVNVNLAVTFFGTGTTFTSFFGNATAQQTLITNLVNQVTTADVKGLNIDFEGTGLSTTYATAFTTFLGNLRTQLLAARPNAEISIDIQGSQAASTNYITNLNAVVDLFILMGYDYYWATQNYPGPIAPTWQFPKATPDPNGHGFVANDLNTMLRFAAKEKVLLAMPYYGRRWRTTNGCVIPANGDTATISTQTYTQFRDNTAGYYNNTLRDPYAFTAYHCFTDNVNRPNQQFIDDTISLQQKYALIKQRGLAGGAIWRLGYDAGYPELWNMVNNNLSTCSITPCSDTLYDMGGPLGNYVSNSNYTFTIAPPGAGHVVLNFYSFNLEQGFDSLRVYNGPSTASPLIGSFTGTTVPGPVVANSGVMTLQFHSDGATVRAGYRALYTCYPDSYIAKTVNSGNWNNPQTWQYGAVPKATDSVMIMAGDTVTVNTSAQVQQLRIDTTAALIIDNIFGQLTVGDITAKNNKVLNNGSLQITAGQMRIYGNVTSTASSRFQLSGGKLMIDGNTGDSATSIANGENLFNIACNQENFSFTGDTLQIINPPLGAASQSINCPYDFGAATVLMFGDGVSTILSNNPAGFGGNLLPAQIGKLVLHAATNSNNRIFKNLTPLTIKTRCDVLSGNLVQDALLTVDSN
jgi:spore germination protein YaaH